MNIIETKATIEFSRYELHSLGYMVECRLVNTAREHYNKLKQNEDGEALFFENECYELNMAKTLYGLGGYNGVYTDMVSRIKTIFEEKQAGREKGGD